MVEVIITSPNETHYPFAKAALEAGKHVLVDKPVTPTASEAKELGELAKSKDLVLYAFQNRRYGLAFSLSLSTAILTPSFPPRWDSDFLALKKLLDLPQSSAQSLGNVVDFESQCVHHAPVNCRPAHFSLVQF